ncbi:hypothetical protein C8Q74DRAFT_1215704 [Fomes fomentarius]|nr:hypothetical protein C8Q74DRAFT_1215704 [Fomes fomentarius]
MSGGHRHLSDDEYEPSQELQRSPPRRFISDPPRATRTGSAQTRALFVEGGALDSQTTESQYVDELILKQGRRDSNAPGVITRDVTVQTDVVQDVERVASSTYSSSLESENDILKAKITRLELAYEALEMHMEDVCSVVNRHDVVLDPFESSQTAIVLSPPRWHAGKCLRDQGLLDSNQTL